MRSIIEKRQSGLYELLSLNDKVSAMAMSARLLHVFEYAGACTPNKEPPNNVEMTDKTKPSTEIAINTLIIAFIVHSSSCSVLG
jgi:hypothetical protein